MALGCFESRDQEGNDQRIDANGFSSATGTFLSSHRESSKVSRLYQPGSFLDLPFGGHSRLALVTSWFAVCTKLLRVLVPCFTPAECESRRRRAAPRAQNKTINTPRFDNTNNFAVSASAAAACTLAGVGVADISAINALGWRSWATSACHARCGARVGGGAGYIIRELRCFFGFAGFEPVFADLCFVCVCACVCVCLCF